MNRLLFRSIREYKKQSILTPLFVILEVLMEVLIPYQMANIIDIGIQGSDLGYVIRTGIILVVMAMLALLFGVFAGKFAAEAGAGYAKNLRHDIFYKIQDFSFKNIDHFSASSLVTRMTTDISNVQMAYMMTIRLMARAPIMIVLSLIMTLTINVDIAIMLLISIPILGGALIFIAKTAHKYFIQVFDEYDVLNNDVQENVNAARVVKAYVREDYENQKFRKISEKVFRLFTKAEKLVALNNPVMMLVMYTVIIIMVLISGEAIVFGNMEAGEMTSVMVYALQILSSLMMVSFVFVMIMIAEASTDRIAEVLTEVPEMQNVEGARTEVPNGDIDFENVNFSYAGEDGKLSLKNVNLHIKSGQMIGIFGGTGSAKTTLVSLIPRLYEATEGTVSVGGRPVKDYTMEHLRDAVSVVLQKNTLFSGTIRENLLWGNPNATDEQLWEACRAACADEFLERMPDGLDTDLGQGGVNVSGGQKQRLCIARAILKQPKVLILDDSTSAVDTATDAKIRQAFANELKDTTKIIIAQRVTSICEADLILVIDRGRIIAQGNHQELMEHCDMYREVYQSQQEGVSIGG